MLSPTTKWYFACQGLQSEGIAKQINKKVLCYAEIGLLRGLTSVVICCNIWFFFVIVLNNVLKLSTKKVSDLLTTCCISAFIPSSLSYEKFPSVQTIFRLFSPILLINFIKTEDFPGPISNAVMRIFFRSTAVQILVFRSFFNVCIQLIHLQNLCFFLFRLYGQNF